MKNWVFLGLMATLLLSPRSGQGSALKFAGEISQVRGLVTVLSQGQTQSKPIPHFALLHDGDLVNLAAGSFAHVRLSQQSTAYSLTGSSRIRVLNGHLLTLSGSVPQPLTTSVASELLPPELFDRSRESQVVRGEGQWGPKDPSPLFTIRGPGVTLRWKGPINPDDAPPGEGFLRVRVQEDGASRWIFTQNLSPSALSVKLPPGILVPGRWYDWTVQVVGPGDVKVAGGPLRVLIPSDRTALARIENTVAVEYSSSPHPAQSRAFLADAYISFGLVEEALQAYQEAKRAGGGPDCAAQIQRLENILRGS